MENFKNAKWIWNKNADGVDSYSEFLVRAEFKKNDAVKLRISSDSNYAVYVNGVFADSGQYADMPHYKVYDEVDLSEYIVDGENHIAFIVWYYGVESFTYYIGKPGVIFEIEKNEEVVLSSNKSVLSRKSKRYISGTRESITMMLGLNYHVDLKESDSWMIGQDIEEFEESIEPEDMPTNLVARIAKKLDVLPITSGEIVMQGSYTYPTDAYLTQHAGDRMMNASIAFFRMREMADSEEKPMTMVRKTGEGIFFIIDMGKESTGYLEFDLEVPEDCLMEVGWGEHLADGRCRSAVGPRRENGATVRNFSVTVRLKKGRNHYMNPFRRLGCRYIQFFIKTSEVKVYDAGLRLTIYPVTPKKFKCGNLLRDTIYELCQHTLIQCMHEHYEDCTWREQSFYTGDSRNQMLAGYYTFGEYDLPKASVRLIAECIRDDDLQGICFPTNVRLTIPGGIPHYAKMLWEYYEHSKDKETMEYCYSAIKRNIDAFVKRIDDTGLIPNFDEAEDFWNFCEWQPYMDGEYYKHCNIPHDQIHDTCLNASLSEGLHYFALISDLVGEDGEPYRSLQENLNKKMAELLYDKEAKLFRVAIGPGVDIKPYSAMANTSAYMCGAAKYVEDTSRMEAVIRDNTSDVPGIEIIPTTFYNSFVRMDMLLQIDEEKYRDTVLEQIDNLCFKMMREGATTFWETELGHKDFDYAGSLCHGWGAMPIIYFERLLKNNES